jgi:uncharacterized protein (DUF58 family)
VCAVVLDERDLLRIGGLLVALPVLSALLCALSLLRLDVTRSVGPQPLAVGDAAHVELRLRAVSRTPVDGLLINDAVPAACGTATTCVVGGLGKGDTATVQYPLALELRGPHMLGPLHVSLADPLGLVELVRTVGDRTPVLVRPRVEPLDCESSSGSSSSEDRAARRGTGQLSRAQTLRDAQLRAYASGDDIRTIHWRSTARRGELIVRTTEQGHTTGTVVLLDVRRTSHSGASGQSSLERAVSLTASLSVHLHRIGIPVRVLTTEGIEVASGEAGLDQLALLTPTDRADLGAVFGLVGADQLIAVFGTLDTAAAAALLEGHAGSASAVHLRPSSGAAILRTAGWNTVDGSVADAGSPLMPSELWSALQRNRTAGR